MDEQRYPTWICKSCGEQHGRRPVGIATWHAGHCDLCGETAFVTEPRDFGGLKTTWCVPPALVERRQLVSVRSDE